MPESNQAVLHFTGKDAFGIDLTAVDAEYDFETLLYLLHSSQDGTVPTLKYLFSSSIPGIDPDLTFSKQVRALCLLKRQLNQANAYFISRVPERKQAKSPYFIGALRGNDLYVINPFATLSPRFCYELSVVASVNKLDHVIVSTTQILRTADEPSGPVCMHLLDGLEEVTDEQLKRCQGSVKTRGVWDYREADIFRIIPLECQILAQESDRHYPLLSAPASQLLRTMHLEWLQTFPEYKCATLAQQNLLLDRCLHAPVQMLVNQLVINEQFMTTILQTKTFKQIEHWFRGIAAANHRLLAEAQTVDEFDDELCIVRLKEIIPVALQKLGEMSPEDRDKLSVEFQGIYTNKDYETMAVFTFTLCDALEYHACHDMGILLIDFFDPDKLNIVADKLMYYRCVAGLYSERGVLTKSQQEDSVDEGMDEEITRKTDKVVLDDLRVAKEAINSAVKIISEHRSLLQKSFKLSNSDFLSSIEDVKEFIYKNFSSALAACADSCLLSDLDASQEFVKELLLFQSELNEALHGAWKIQGSIFLERGRNALISTERSDHYRRAINCFERSVSTPNWYVRACAQAGLGLARYELKQYVESIGHLVDSLWAYENSKVNNIELHTTAVTQRLRDCFAKMKAAEINGCLQAAEQLAQSEPTIEHYHKWIILLRNTRVKGWSGALARGEKAMASFLRKSAATSASAPFFDKANGLVKSEGRVATVVSTQSDCGVSSLVGDGPR